MFEQKDYDLDNLLELDGEIFFLDDDHWVKFKVKKVAPSEFIPHGIDYSLTLHNSANERILGYDNAHGIKPKGMKYSAKRTAWDHKHQRNSVETYTFENAGQLLEDFWNAVEKIIEEGKR
ncbi:MAG: DUF6516 family protein [Leptolyngbyaceae bacterium]|nr:DUF6516 family protein [Leptolyngbyaceae bacterium]